MGIFAFLKERMPALAAERDFDFSRHTTIGCGGRAEVAVFPSSPEELCALLRLLKETGIPYFLLGAGANVLPQDEFFEGVVVRFSRMNALRREKDAIVAAAGVTGGALLRFARGEALSGFEPLCGIPMTVGGGTAMNAGIPLRHFSDLAEEVEAVAEGKLIRLQGRECGFAEKDSIFRGRIAVVSVRMRGAASTEEHILREEEKFRTRRGGLPHGRSMGCVFVNPPFASAGRLIEECGLMGTRIGGAVVSTQHANFILNEGGTASDVAALADRVREEVRRKKGVSLREEIRRFRGENA